MELIVFTIIVVVFIITIFFTWFFHQQARNKERLMLIEKGENLDKLLEKRERRFSFPWLKSGILILGLSFGFLGMSILEYFHIIGNEPLYLFVLGFCGGVAMIIAHRVEKRQEKK